MPSEAGAREIGKSNPHFVFRCAYDLQNHFFEEPMINNFAAEIN
jgi:hypothetical protein